MFNAFVKVIPNFTAAKRMYVEFTIICFDGVDIIG